MDFGALIRRFGTGTYTVTRTTRGQTIRGRTEEGTVTTFEIEASLSPANGIDLQLLPEGRSVDDVRQLFTTTELLTGDQGAGYEADEVAIAGFDYQVIRVEPWQDPTRETDVMYRCILSVE